MSYFRENIKRMSGYVPGEQPQGERLIKLNTNENPYPPSPRSLEAARAWLDADLRLYPDPVARQVRECVGRLFDVDPDCVLVGNGSDDLLTIAFRSFVDPGQTVAFPTPTYSLYPVLTEIQDGRVLEVPFPTDFSLPPDLLGVDAALTLLANPNSPTATLIPPHDVARLAESLDGVLLVDEAYVDFADSHCVDLAKRHDNVIVTRSFSKSFALCGLRLGYAVAHPALINGMMKVKDSYSVNRMAAVAGAAALEDIDYMRQSADRIRATRARLSKALEELGCFVYPSQANFVFARVPSPLSARHLYESLKSRRILVRYFDASRLDDCLRITVGTDDEITTLLENLDELMRAT